MITQTAQHLYLPGMFPKQCSCGRVYTLRDWLRLHYVGIMDGMGKIPDLEMRDCFCRSTMAVKLAGHKGGTMRNVILLFSVTLALIVGVEIGEKVTSKAYEHVIADIRKAHDNGMVSRQELKALRRFAAILWREARLDPEAVGDLDKPNFSYGPCQFQQRTFDEFKVQAGMSWLEWTNPEHQLILTWWAVKNGKARAWSVIKNSTEF